MTTYNSQKDNLIIREYGRNTQNLINHAKSIEDREKRQKYVERVVRLIMSMHPYTRNVDDYRLKVWSHVLKMADYDLDVDIPANLPDARKKRKPDNIKYPVKSRKLRHYGKNVKSMVEKAKLMTDPEQQKAYIAIIGSFMKMSYKSWNRENVNDEVISEEFFRISNGELSIPKGLNIDALCTTRKKKSSGSNSTRKSSNRYSNSKNSTNKKNSKSKNSKNRNFTNKNSRNKKR
jgi:hypothetical protein